MDLPELYGLNRDEQVSYNPTVLDFNPILTVDFFLPPYRPVELSVLNRLGEVRRGDFVFTRQIGDCPRDFQYAVIGPSRSTAT